MCDARASVEVALSTLDAQVGDEVVPHLTFDPFRLVQVALVAGAVLMNAFDNGRAVSAGVHGVEL